MPDLQPSSQNDFMVERIKVKPVNRKKLLRRTLLTVGLAVLFGLVACFTFLILEPVISNWLYPPEQQGTQMVVFPEDQDEMSPEEMLAENLPVESPSPEPQGGPEEGQNPEGEPQEPTLREQVTEILADIPLELRHYKELFSALSAYVNELNHSMVTVTAVTSNIDWLNDVRESRNQCPGLIFSENGMDLLILTKYSAVMSAERLLLTFWEGSQVEARLKQYNGEMDLAVLKVEGQDLPAAEFGISDDLRVGDPAYAIGNPLGIELRNTMTSGSISAINRDVDVDGVTMTLIQTDAALNSGNSGGPLINQYGQVIGINTIKMMSEYDTIEGLGFAIPSSLALRWVNELIEYGELLPQPVLGVTINRIPVTLPDGALGLRVESLTPNLSGYAAGLQEGDYIVMFNNQPVASTEEVLVIRRSLYVGDQVPVLIYREGEYLELMMTMMAE